MRLIKLGFTFDDPLEAAKKTLAEIKDKADINVIVGYFKGGTANKLATAKSAELDLIIAYDERGLVADPKQVNNTLIVWASKQSKYLGELRFYADSTGQISRFTNRYVDLDSVIPDDPAMLEMTKKARAEIGIVQQRIAEEVAAAHAANSNNTSAFMRLQKPARSAITAEYEKWKRRDIHTRLPDSKPKIARLIMPVLDAIRLDSKKKASSTSKPRRNSPTCNANRVTAPEPHMLRMPKKGYTKHRLHLQRASLVTTAKTARILCLINIGGGFAREEIEEFSPPMHTDKHR